ncbi:MAG: ROK family transcriptional regulator [Amaricoccus sp.]|nr:ROK family transcriptional regulator [Amaricoccus sp.]
MRAYNERLVLSLVRRHGALAKTEIARMTGLSAQTVSVIMRHLEADRLLRRGEPQRGRVGQPSVPLSLDPEGAFFVGAKVGRRSLEIVLVDFAGAVRWRTQRTYRHPRPGDTVRAIVEGVAAVEALLGPAAARRIAGIGLATPFALWSWAEAMGAPEAEMAAWRDADLRGELAALLPYPVYLQNDATAACGAELAFGAGVDLSDFLYLHVGAFVGGGLVLNGGLVAGRTGNAAALGSMPVQDAGGRMVQLIEIASLVVLERRLSAASAPVSALFDLSGDWSIFEPHLGRWIAEAGRGMAQAIAAASAVIELEAALIDGAFPAPVRARLIVAIEASLAEIDLSGVDPPAIRAGTLGPIARAIGGASLPLFDRYLVGRHAPAAVSGRPQPGPG